MSLIANNEYNTEVLTTDFDAMYIMWYLKDLAPYEYLYAHYIILFMDKASFTFPLESTQQVIH